MKTFPLILLTLLILSGCAFQKPAPDTYYGFPPTDMTESIPEAMAYHLKDPNSAQYRYSGVAVKGYMNDGLAHGGKVGFTGWMVPFEVNAKNSYGGYTGYEPYIAFYETGRSIQFIKPGYIDRNSLITVVE